MEPKLGQLPRKYALYEEKSGPIRLHFIYIIVPALLKSQKYSRSWYHYFPILQRR